jgi:hypothetical protein
MSDGPGTVWLLSIEHRHGANHSAHLTERGAQDAVYDHVCTWWDEEANRWSDEPQAQPDDPDEAAAYRNGTTGVPIVPFFARMRALPRHALPNLASPRLTTPGLGPTSVSCPRGDPGRPSVLSL